MSLTATAIVESKTGYAQNIRSGRHRLTADEPESAGGTDTGPSPFGLLLSGLGACTSITLRMYAQKKGWELGEIHIALRHYEEGDASRIEREIRFSAPLTAEQRTRLLEIAEKTPVTRAVAKGAPIETRMV
jgi:putative redox protein